MVRSVTARNAAEHMTATSPPSRLTVTLPTHHIQVLPLMKCDEFIRENHNKSMVKIYWFIGFWWDQCHHEELASRVMGTGTIPYAGSHCPFILGSGSPSVLTICRCFHHPKWAFVTTYSFLFWSLPIHSVQGHSHHPGCSMLHCHWLSRTCQRFAYCFLIIPYSFIIIPQHLF